MSSTSLVAALFQPLQLGPITLKNRIFISALTRNRSVPTNVPNEINVEYYEQRAGSAGLIISEGVLITRQGTEWPWAPGIWSQEQIHGWKKVTDTVHEQESFIFAQLWHLGRVSHPDAPEQIASGKPVYAPSAISARGGKFRHLPGTPGYVTPTVLDDPMTIIELYKQAAINAKEAGFDGVELHAASGYLVNQFLDSTSNHRTDEWGGSIENRARFALEALKVLIEVWGADRVGMRVTPAQGFNDMGMPLSETIETYSYFISEADKLGIVYINLVRYIPHTDWEFDGKKRGTPHDVISTYAPLIKHATIFSNGAFTPEEAASFVADGKVAGIFFGVPWIANPDLAKRIQCGKPLNDKPTVELFYGHGGDLEEQRKGYTDYPLANYE
ncbi:hypothetical protein VKT23_014085 [Stygiomarasmius scandens]|uniref:NADH:flavin oxidoreductase/NADH oxidase N-terminal domain-containing protein n=1 Tax=Marasmiellus scandens TaxID=2682957 RepID=A0ABR1J3U5_9AGAR